MRSTQTNRAPRPARILLVDDNHDGVLARGAVLEELGYTVVPAHSGAEALACLAEQSCDLMITDYKMSPMDGVELIRTLRGHNISMPIILLSGFTDCIGLAPESTGADVVLQKSANEVAMLARYTKRLLTPKKPAGSQREAQTKVRARGQS
jgi:CheY-like chemotaxis protein